MKSRSETRDRMAEVIKPIIDAIETGLATGEWEAPWTSLGLWGRPRNIEGRVYTGGNAINLMIAAALAGAPSPVWGTFNQWKAAGFFPRKGEKATAHIFRPIMRSVAEDMDGALEKDGALEEEPRKVIIGWGCHPVFHCGQVFDLDGNPWKPAAEVPAPVFDTDEAAELFLLNTGAEVIYGGDRAFYSPAGDHIRMPEKGQFASQGGFYATLFHELVHWAGAESRLPRSFPGLAGRAAYAAEELVAELGSALLCADLGVENTESRQDHQEYLAHWLQVLKEKPSFLWSVASKAEKAVEYLHSLQNEAAIRKTA